MLLRNGIDIHRENGGSQDEEKGKDPFRIDNTPIGNNNIRTNQKMKRNIMEVTEKIVLLMHMEIIIILVIL